MAAIASLPFLTLAQLTASTGGYGSIRDYDGDGNPLPPGVTRPHLARDIYLPAGTDVRLFKPMVFDHWGTSNSTNEDMGFVYVFKTGNQVWRFIHIAKANRNLSWTKGQKVAKGSVIGHTSFHDLGRHPSHLHLDVEVNGVRVDPFSIMSLEEVNAMVGGAGGIAPWILFAAALWGGYELIRRL